MKAPLQHGHAHAGGHQTTSRVDPRNLAALEAFAAAPPGRGAEAVDEFVGRRPVPLRIVGSNPANRAPVVYRSIRERYL